MFDQVYNYENYLYVNGQKILGIDSLDISYSHSTEINKYIGYSVGNTSITGPVTQKVSITRHLLYQDPLYVFATGTQNMSGSLHYQSNLYGFKSGYIDEYMVNCAVGSLPRVTTNATIYDEMATGTSKSASGQLAAPDIFIPNQGSISIVCDNSSTNRVSSFDYSVKAYRKPIYSIGSKQPVEIMTNFTKEYSASVQIEVDDAFLASGMALFSRVQGKSISFNIKGRLGDSIQSLTIPKASLISETLNSTADGGIKLTLNYIGHQ